MPVPEVGALRNNFIPINHSCQFDNTIDKIIHLKTNDHLGDIASFWENIWKIVAIIPIEIVKI